MSMWQVELTRHQFDLEDLPRWFTAPELRVVEQGGHFLLEAWRSRRIPSQRRYGQ